MTRDLDQTAYTYDPASGRLDGIEAAGGVDLELSQNGPLPTEQTLAGPVAGSVSTAKQINDLKKAGADAFTIGSAAFDGSYAPDRGHLLSQLAAIQADCAKAG